MLKETASGLWVQQVATARARQRSRVAREGSFEKHRSPQGESFGKGV